MAISDDDPEPNPATGLTASPPADIRYVAYRTLRGEENCDFILEFAFQLWERRQTLSNVELQVEIDVDGDSVLDYVLANRGPRKNDFRTSECRIQDSTGSWTCAGFAPDHPTNSGTAIIRACSNDFGIQPWRNIGVSFSSTTFPKPSAATIDKTAYMEIRVPSTISSTPTSFDLRPGGKVVSIPLSDGTDIRNPYALGLLILSNGYRSRDSTGAASATSEAIAIPFPGVQLPKEQTEDSLSFMQTPFKAGPGIGWSAGTSTCSAPRKRKLAVDDVVLEKQRISDNDIQGERDLNRVCPENFVPRVFLEIEQPSAAPTNRPSEFPASQSSSTALPFPTDFFTPTRNPTKSPEINGNRNGDIIDTNPSSSSNAEGEVYAASSATIKRARGHVFGLSVVLSFFLFR